MVDRPSRSPSRIPWVAAVLLAALAAGAGAAGGFGPVAPSEEQIDVSWSAAPTPAGEPMQGIGGSPTWLVAVSETGTAYRSTDDGQHWEAIEGLPSLSKARVESDPHDPEVGYVAAVDGVWRTQDAGETWEQVLSVDRAARIDVGTTGLVLVGARYEDASNHVLLSSDRGESWEDLGARLPDDEPLCGVAFGRSSEEVMTMTDEASWYSHDGGDSWTETPGAGLDFAVPDDGVVWRNEMAYLERTVDGGATWERVDPPAIGAPIGPRPGGGIFLASTDGVLSTTDGGQTWENLGYSQVSLGVNSLQGDPSDPDAVLLADDEIGISRVALDGDGVPILEGRTNGLSPAPLDDVETSAGGQLAVATGPHGVWARHEPGGEWAHTGAGLAAESLDALAVSTDGSTAYIGGQDATEAPVIEASLDGGHRFHTHHFTLPDPGHVAGLAVDPEDSMRAAVALSTQGPLDEVRLTEDGGQTWTTLAELPLAVQDVAWHGPTGGLLVASDAGLVQVFEPGLVVPGLPAPEAGLVASHAGQAVAAGGANGGLWRGLAGTGAMAPWTGALGGLAALAVDAGEPDRAWAASETGALLLCSGEVLEGSCEAVGPEGVFVSSAWVDPHAGQVLAASGSGLFVAAAP